MDHHPDKPTDAPEAQGNRTTEPPPEASSDRNIYALFVDRPILTLMITSAILLIGIIAFTRLPLQLVPNGLSSNEINVYIPMQQGMSPRETEDKVIEPLEEQLRTIAGLKRISSRAGDDYGRVSIELDEGLDPTLAAAEVRDRAQRAMASWPEGVDRYLTWREDASSVPLAFFQMLTPSRGGEWDYLLEEVLQPRLEAVDGVGRVEFWGLRRDSIRIFVDRDKLVAHRISYRDLISKLGSDNFKEPIGELDDGRQRFLVRVDQKFRSLSEIERYPIQPGLELRDVARIERVQSLRDSVSRYNQKFTYSGTIRSTAGANPVEASKRVKAAIEELKLEPRFAGLDFRFLLDQGELIEESLDTLISTSLQGGVLALLALFIFLWNFRFTVAIALAIPLALLITGGYVFFSGGSLNILTMAGMTLAVGMVVDNSVVVLENVRRLRAKGYSPRKAAIEGAREVGLAVTMATMTTVVIILPMVFIGDTRTRILLGAVGITLSVALVGSLFVALLLMPSALARGKNSAFAVDPEEDRHLPKWSPIRWLMGFNHVLLSGALKVRWLAVVGLVLLILLIKPAFSGMDFESDDGGPFSRGDITVRLEMPPGLSLRQVNDEAIAYENYVLGHKEEWAVESVSCRLSRRSIRLDVQIEREVAKSDRVADIRKAIEENWPPRPGVEIRLSDSDRGGMSGGGSQEEKKQRNFVLRLYGRDTDYLLELAQSISTEIEALPQVDTVEIPQLEDRREVIVAYDRDRLQELGVQPAQIHAVTSSGLQGRSLSKFEERGRETQLIIEFDADANPSLLDLKETQIMRQDGTTQRLADLAKVGFKQATGTIRRYDGKVNVTLVGRRKLGVGANEMTEALAALMRTRTLPRGYTWTQENAFRQSEVEMAELTDAMYLGVVLVFLLMGILFESIVLPGAILFTIPFALLGAALSLRFFFGSLDVMCFVGFILLCGIVVNNGIVLLDCIHRLRSDGMPRDQAILLGTRQRLRPIVMTATTTIVGLLPMAIFGESTGNGLSYVGMSYAVAGGLAMCTVFTAFVVPLAYTLFDDLRHWMLGCFRRGVGDPAAQPGGSATASLAHPDPQ